MQTSVWVCARGQATGRGLCGSAPPDPSLQQWPDPPPWGLSPAMKYHYLHRRFTHRVEGERQPPALHTSVPDSGAPFPGDATAPPLRAPSAAAWLRPRDPGSKNAMASGHRSDGEFGWGGTPVTMQRRRPEASLRWNRNLPRRSRPKALLIRRPSVRVQSAQAWPCDPLAEHTGSGY